MKKMAVIMFFCIICGSLSAEEEKPGFLYKIQEFVTGLEFADDGGLDLFGVHFLATSCGLDMTCPFPVEDASGDDAGRVMVSFSPAAQAAEWYMLDCTIGYYFDLTDYLFMGIETGWSIIDSGMHFFLKPMANLKIGKIGLIKGWYEVDNLIAGNPQTDDLFLQLSFSWSF